MRIISRCVLAEWKRCLLDVAFQRESGYVKYQLSPAIFPLPQYPFRIL
jgi:hypothetical protein